MPKTIKDKGLEKKAVNLKGRKNRQYWVKDAYADLEEAKELNKPEKRIFTLQEERMAESMAGSLR